MIEDMLTKYELAPT